MDRQPRKKSGHLQDLENVFEQRTRRFSPFVILGLRNDENTVSEDADFDTDPANQIDAATKEKLPSMGVDTTPIADTNVPQEHVQNRSIDALEALPPPMGVDTTPMWGCGTPRQVVVKDLNTTTTKEQPTPMGVDTTPIADVLQDQPTKDLSTPETVLRMRDVVAASNFKAELSKKARHVLGYLNSIRSEKPELTIPVSYGQISSVTDIDMHYLRRNVLPKLMMLGLISIVHKAMQGTSYHLHYDSAFMQLVVGEGKIEAEFLSAEMLRTDIELANLDEAQPHSPELTTTLPPWIDREHWSWITPTQVSLLIDKAGSETQAQEKLNIILYNETHGPNARRVRDRRALLTHYLRTPQADIWANDNGYETIALRRAREERNQALKEKELVEETLRIRQEAAKARFLAALSDAQGQWIKNEAKRRVDIDPKSRFLSSRYPLYKAEEERLIAEWLDRIEYGEEVPSIEG